MYENTQTSCMTDIFFNRTKSNSSKCIKTFLSSFTQWWSNIQGEEASSDDWASPNKQPCFYEDLIPDQVDVLEHQMKKPFSTESQLWNNNRCSCSAKRSNGDKRGIQESSKWKQRWMSGHTAYRWRCMPSVYIRHYF